MQQNAHPIRSHGDGKSPTRKRTNQRRTLKQFLIDPFRQVRFGLYYIVLNLLSFNILGVLFWSTSVRQYDQLLVLFEVAGDEKSKVLLNDVFLQNLALLAAVFGLLAVATLGLTIWLTHRIYGPQVAITKFVREFARGNLHARIRLRRGDEFHDLADELNQMASLIEARAASQGSRPAI